MSARILVVDDIQSNLKLLQVRLSAEYFEVMLASNGQEALKMCEQGQCDIVLLDVMMPHMDGFEVARRIKSNAATHHIPIIMITALDQPADRVKGLESGADDFLTKPVDDIALVARVRSLVRLKMATAGLPSNTTSTSAFWPVDASRGAISWWAVNYRPCGSGNGLIELGLYGNSPSTIALQPLAATAPDVGSYAPVTILIAERAPGTTLSYDRVASALAPYASDEASVIAGALDDAVLHLLQTAAGAAKGRRRRASSGSTTIALAGTANHKVVRGASGESVLRPTSRALAAAASTINASRPWRRASDRKRLTG